jgi:hypothetical protein
MRDNEYSMLMLVLMLMMIWRPQGLLPMTRPQLKLKNGQAKGRAGMSQPLLSVNGLMMRFGGLLAVNNVPGSAQERDCLLIGLNGAGKQPCLTA